MQFPRARHLGCHFHFAQAVNRKDQEMGLSTHYLENLLIRTFFEKCVALAFIPQDKVLDIFNQMKDGLDGLEKDLLVNFVDYFICTWLDGVFHISMWNKYGLDHQHRTNKALESWHSKLEQSLTVHPNIYTFILGLKKLHEYAKIKLSEATAMMTPPKRKLKYRKLDEIMKNAHDSHVHGEIRTDELLSKIRYLVNISKK